jgi:hypothetical protein
MKAPFTLALLGVLTASLSLGSAQAGERGFDAAAGAAAGALVAGPVGLIAGGVIGYTAGPAIAGKLGMNQPRRKHRAARQRSASR